MPPSWPGPDEPEPLPSFGETPPSSKPDPPDPSFGDWVDSGPELSEPSSAGATGSGGVAPSCSGLVPSAGCGEGSGAGAAGASSGCAGGGSGGATAGAARGSAG